MKEFLFDGTSRFSRFVFQRLLKGMDSRFRHRLNDPHRIVRASGVQTGQSVLEVGCGSGFFTPALSDSVGEQGLVQSVDLHPMAVETTSEKVRTLGMENVRVSRADAHETNFPDASFDTIVVYGVVPAPVISEKRLGREMYRLLKPGGVLAVWTIVPFWSPKSLMQAAHFALYEKRQGVHRLQKVVS